jgi:hypothetical protein
VQCLVDSYCSTQTEMFIVLRLAVNQIDRRMRVVVIDRITVSIEAVFGGAHGVSHCPVTRSDAAHLNLRAVILTFVL